MAQIKRYEELMESMIANMVSKQDKITDFNEGSVIHSLLDTNARIAERLYVAIRQGYTELLGILPYSPFRFTRKTGTQASGTVTFFRKNILTVQTVIPKGTVVCSGGLKFTTTEAGIILPGKTESDEVNAIAQTFGMGHNVAQGFINEIETAVPSEVIKVTNKNAFTGGTEEETDIGFEERFRTYLNGLSGTNVYAVKSAALSVNSVRSVSVQNHKPPLKDIYNMSIYVDDGSGGASKETLEAVKSIINGDGTENNPGHLAPGVNIRVLPPTSLPINLSLSIYIYASTNKEEAEQEIREVLSDYVNGLTIGKPLILSEVITKIMTLPYIRDVKILNPTDNVEPGINLIARLGTVDIAFWEID